MSKRSSRKVGDALRLFRDAMREDEQCVEIDWSALDEYAAAGEVDSDLPPCAIDEENVLLSIWRRLLPKIFEQYVEENSEFQSTCRIVRTQIESPDVSADWITLAQRCMKELKSASNGQRELAIHKAGIALNESLRADAYDLDASVRVELLEKRILELSKQVFEFDSIEVWLFDAENGKLVPWVLHGAGYSKETILARSSQNGASAFVAASSKSYLCENMEEDSLFQGDQSIGSSITVPLVQDQKMIGTFSIQKEVAHAFMESDIRLVETFAYYVKMELVAMESALAEKSMSESFSLVSRSADEILDDSIVVMEHYIGVEPRFITYLQRILRNGRDIKRVAANFESEAKHDTDRESHDLSRFQLTGRRVLVADADEAVRISALALLERCGCIVESATNGGEVVSLVQAAGDQAPFDVIIADLRLPDCSAYELLLELKKHLNHVPLVLLSGLGYDPGHSIVKCRQAGLLPNAVLYKPFRRDQLFATIEAVMTDYLQNVATLRGD